VTPEKELEKAQVAKAFLEHSPFTEAVREIESAILSGIKQSAFKDAELREKLCQEYRVLQSIVDRIRTYIETGKLAEEEIRRKSITERIRSIL